MITKRNRRKRSATPTVNLSAYELEALRYCSNLSGYNKQTYIYRRATDKAIIVKGLPNVYIALKREMEDVLNALKAIPDGGNTDDSLQDRINTIRIIYNGMKEEN